MTSVWQAPSMASSRKSELCTDTPINRRSYLAKQCQGAVGRCVWFQMSSRHQRKSSGSSRPERKLSWGLGRKWYLPALLWEMSSRRPGPSQHRGIWHILHIRTYWLIEERKQRGGWRWEFHTRNSMCKDSICAHSFPPHNQISNSQHLMPLGHHHHKTGKSPIQGSSVLL